MAFLQGFGTILQVHVVVHEGQCAIGSVPDGGGGDRGGNPGGVEEFMEEGGAQGSPVLFASPVPLVARGDTDFDVHIGASFGEHGRYPEIVPVDACVARPGENARFELKIPIDANGNISKGCSFVVAGVLQVGPFLLGEIKEGGGAQGKKSQEEPSHSSGDVLE